MTEIAGLSCACGETDLIAVAPGSEPEKVDLFTARIAISHGTPAVAWCAACWPTKAAAVR